MPKFRPSRGNLVRWSSIMGARCRKRSLRRLRFLNGKPERIENGVCTTLVPILYNLMIYFQLTH